MVVRCNQCGEELLGSVNRCWNCGYTFATIIDANEPPICRSPIPWKLVLESARSGAASPHEEVAAIRMGSPFAPVASSVDAAPTGTGPDASRRIGRISPAARSSGNHASVGNAIASLLLGAVAFLIALVSNYPGAGIGVGLLGIGMGLWGMRAPRWRLSFVGLLLCCLALSTGSIRTGVQIYTRVVGHSPFSPPADLQDQ